MLSKAQGAAATLNAEVEHLNRLIDPKSKEVQEAISEVAGRAKGMGSSFCLLASKYDAQVEDSTPFSIQVEWRDPVGAFRSYKLRLSLEDVRTLGIRALNDDGEYDTISYFGAELLAQCEPFFHSGNLDDA